MLRRGCGEWSHFSARHIFSVIPAKAQIHYPDGISGLLDRDRTCV
jgi:hypothetical protein